MKSSDVAVHYDTLDVWYRTLWGDHLHHGLWLPGTADHHEAGENLLLAIARDLRPGMSVCDVGCGYGGPARWLARKFGVEVLAITNSPRQAAAADPAAGVEFRLADWLENDLPAHAFDAVLAIESTSHFPDPAAAIREMARVLKQDGRLVIATWIIAEEIPAWARWGLIEPIRRTGKLPGLADEPAHRTWMAGMDLVDLRHFGPQVRRTWSSGMGRALRALFSDGRLAADAIRHPLQALRLALSSARIWLAYRLGLLDYAIFVLTPRHRTSP